MMRVEEYKRHFTKMMRYTPDDVNTDKKKRFWFHRGLHHGIHQIVAGSDHSSLARVHMVNRAMFAPNLAIGPASQMFRMSYFLS